MAYTSLSTLVSLTRLFTNWYAPSGTYDRNLLASSTTIKSNVPPFEWDGFMDRFRRPSRSWEMAPNRYDPIDRGTIQTLLNKVVSKRGPYDLFTGPRDNTTIKNHFAPPERCTPDKYYTWLQGLDFLLHHPSKRLYAHSNTSGAN